MGLTPRHTVKNVKHLSGIGCLRLKSLDDLDNNQPSHTLCTRGIGLSVILHQRMCLKIRKRTVQVPIHKQVTCRTRDLHQSLLAKLDRALARDRHQDAIPSEDAGLEVAHPLEMSQV